MKSQLPNLITLLNLFCGTVAIQLVFNGKPEYVWLLLLIGLLADVADGLVARLLNVHSELGKQLDSLADMVSFGVLPGAMMFACLQSTLPEGAYLPYAGFFITLFSALRLGKFNLDPAQSNDFIGMPTPSGAILVYGIYGILQFDLNGWAMSLASPYLLLGVTALTCYLLVSPLPMFSLKFKHYRLAGNEFKYGLLLAISVAIPVFGPASFSFLILLYVLLSALKLSLQRNEE